LYLDGRFDDAERIFESLVKSIERELEDFSDENAETEIERKKFERKRSKLNKNLGIVYFYLGNNYLLSGRDEDAEYAYTQAQELSGLMLASTDNTSAGEELSMEEMAWKDELANNLSVAFVKNEKLEEAEQILENVEADKGEHPMLAQNLGLIYLEQGMKQGVGNVVASSAKGDTGTSKSSSSKTEDVLPAAPSEIDDADYEDEGSGDDQIYSNNENFRKAQEIFAKLEEKIQKQESMEEPFLQAQMAQDVYRNHGILSLVNEDYDKAKDYFEKEIEELQNEKKELKKKRRKVQKQVQMIQQQQQVQMPNNFEEPSILEGEFGELEENMDDGSDLFDDEWEDEEGQDEEDLEEEEEEAYRLLKKVKQHLGEEMPDFDETEEEMEASEGDEEWGEWGDEHEEESERSLIPRDFSGDIFNIEIHEGDNNEEEENYLPGLDEEEKRRILEKRLEEARIINEEEEERMEERESEKIMEEKHIELERLEGLREEMERIEEENTGVHHEEVSSSKVTDTKNVEESQPSTEDHNNFQSSESENFSEPSGGNSEPSGGGDSSGGGGGGLRR
ncbi:hypothetical protein HON22_01710, partial [Candidatus Peregrinibacteria bacterium]|nr:hypothetical protein [Candidatus Peregrinibacteria bacterium]